MPPIHAPSGAEWEPKCWVNGHPMDPGAPALSVSDRGFTLADGCFETMRAYGGVVFQLDAHLARLASTAERLGISVPPHLDATIADAVRVLRASRADAAVRLTLTRGSGSGLAPSSLAPPTTVLLVDRLPAAVTQPPTARDRHGLRLHLASGRRNEFAPTAGLKTLSYTDAVIALAAARAAGADDALLLDTEGHLSEGSASNVFLVIRGVIHTPPLSCGVLPGITRAVVIDCLRQLDLPLEESPIPSSALSAADEIFLTSSLREIAPVVSVDHRPVGLGAPGPVTVRLLEAFRRLVREAVADEMAADPLPKVMNAAPAAGAS
jgi:branched-chain amino acid aminotransferase